MLVKLDYGGENETRNFLKEKTLDNKALERPTLPERWSRQTPKALGTRSVIGRPR